jgi:hypothetical protein
MPTLMVTATLVRHMHPLLATAALSSACALGTHEPSGTFESAVTSFTLEAHGPQRAAGHMAVSEPSQVGRRGLEPHGM